MKKLEKVLMMKPVSRLLKKESIETYNNEWDGDLTYEEVQKELAENLDFAIESLAEQLRDVKDRWFNHHYRGTEFLTVPSEIVEDEEFVNEVINHVFVEVEVEE